MYTVSRGGFAYRLSWLQPRASSHEGRQNVVKKRSKKNVESGTKKEKRPQKKVSVTIPK